jgi:lipopolysaccharide export system protein LptA
MLRDKILIWPISLCLGLAALHVGGTPSAVDEGDVHTSAGEVRILAEHEVKEGGTLKLRGHVEVRSGSMTVHADEAEYNALNGRVEARGHVHIELGKTTPKITIQNSTPEDSPVAPGR